MSAALPLVCFKVTLVRRSGPTLHRFRGAFAWQEFQSVVTHLWGCKRVKVEYSDAEGDAIVVASPLEWEECVRLHIETQEQRRTAEPLRLTVTKVSGKDSTAEAAPTATAAAATAASAAPADDDDADTLPRERAATVPPVVPPLALPHAAPAPQPSLPASYAEGPVMALLSALFVCNAAHELCQPFPAVDMSAAVQRVVDAASLEVRLDVDTRALRHLSVVQGNRWMDQGLLAESLRLLRAAVLVFPGDAILAYNAACAAALSGEADLSLDLLAAAIDGGYADEAKIRSDEDLAAIRQTVRFAAILAAAFPPPAVQPEVAAPAAPDVAAEVAVVAPVPVAVAVAVAPPVTGRTQQVMSIFPQLTAAAAKLLLEQHRNVVAVAVDAKLRE